MRPPLQSGDMALSSLRARLISEFAVPYIVVAVSLAALIPLSFIYHPVGYIRLVTEDNLGEFGTAIRHLIAAIMLLVSATKPVPRSTRII